MTKITIFKHTLFIYFLLSLFYITSYQLSIFCSIACSINSCVNQLSNGCNTCSPYFVLAPATTAPSSCIFDNAQTLYKLSKQTYDFNIIPSNLTTCSANYSFYGKYTNTTNMSFTTITPISDPHYAIELIVWVILMDRWKNTGSIVTEDYVGFNLVGTNQTFYTSGTYSPRTTQDYCGSNDKQTFTRFTQQYIHTNTISNLQFVVDVRTTYNNMLDGQWGIKDIFIVTKLCHTYCIACTGPNSNNCSNCNIGSFLSGTTCAPTCLTGYGQNSTSNVCILCHVYCSTCYNAATNCSACLSNITNGTTSKIYKLEDANQCQITCPPGYFSFDATSQCLLCSSHCVTLAITNSVDPSLLFTDFIFTFSQSINFTGFTYTNFVDLSTLSTTLNISTDFNITYTMIDAFSFKLTLVPTTGIKFEQTQFCATTIAQNSSNLQFSLNLYPLHTSVYSKSSCLSWGTPVYSIFTIDQQNFYKSLQNLNNKIEQFTTQKGTQQIIKSGILNFLIPGAQLSSTILLHNPRISQNLYQGTRFWGSFVYFDVPPFGKNSAKTKYTFSDPNQQIISKSRKLQEVSQLNLRNLQTTSFINQWKFQRTGHTGYFVIDTYIQLILIAACWIVFFISRYLQNSSKFKKLTKTKLKTVIMAIFHKVHQVSFFYLILSALIQLQNYQSSYLHLISIIISAIFLLYYLAYQLKIFYDMIDYPQAKLHTPMYEYYLQNYAIFLAYIRFQEYNDKQKWSSRHFLRPYNYPTLTFFKRATMLLAIPIFYQYGLVPVIILTIIQSLDIIRFILTLPYQSRVRNFAYFLIECTLLAFFICSLINQDASTKLYDAAGQIADASYIGIYKSTGWAGMYLIFIYNILYILGTFTQLAIFIFTKNSYLQMMWKNRNQYYQDLYEHYQQYGSYYQLVKNYTQELAYSSSLRQVKSYKDWVNRLHGAQPIVDLSQQKKKVYKSLIQRGNIFKTEFPTQDQEQSHFTQVKIQTFTISDFNNVYHSDTFSGQLYQSNNQYAPKNVDKYFNQQKKYFNLNQQTKSVYSDHKRPQRPDPQTRSIKSAKNIDKLIKQSNFPSFDIEYKIIPQIFKSSNKNSKKQRKLHYPKIIKNVIKSEKLNKRFQKNLAMSLISYAMPGTQQLKLFTFLIINLNDYQEGQQVLFIRDNMRQQIQITRSDGKHRIALSQVMSQFPVDWEVLEKSSQKAQSKIA